MRKLTNAVAATLALLWRRMLTRTTVIGITGSVGKTTCKECLAAILGARFPIAYSDTKSPPFRLPPILALILRTARRHRFLVAEIGVLKPGDMWRSARVLRPDVAVVLSVRWQHSAAFDTLDDIAAEKANLLRAVHPGGLAILNIDDPRVAAMADPARFRVATFGTTPAADLWATGIASPWPKRLEFHVHSAHETHKVETRLVGTHWVPSVLAAFSVALHCGVRLEDAIESVRHVEPFPARLDPRPLPNGAILLRDEYNGAMDTLLRALTVLEQATAGRRVAVIGNTTDAREKGADLAARIGRDVARVSDMAVFIGEHARVSAQAAVEAGMNASHAHALRDPDEAPPLLARELRAGDLVLLRGRFTDHLSRLYFAQLGSVSCWKRNCELPRTCDQCPELGFRPDPRPTLASPRGL